MAKFKFKGEPERKKLVKKMGPIIEIRIPKKDGSKIVIGAKNKTVGFAANDALDVDIDDPRAIRSLEADPRFERTE